MSLARWGVLLGAGVAGGLLLIAARIRAIRRPPLVARVLPYLRDLPASTPRPASGAHPATELLLGPARFGARLLERLLGGSAALQRRLDRAGLDHTPHDFRVEQVLWGLAGFGLAAAWGVMRQLGHHGGRAGSALGSLVLCAAALCTGMICRDSRLTRQVAERERRMVAEFPTVAELLALSVAAGESAVAAIDRVAERAHGPLRDELASVLADVRTGTPVGAAFDGLAARTGLALVARFANGIATAVERGTPLADVLHAQAADVREAGRRELIETAARKEVVMMAPVVLLVLPAVVLVVLYPGLLQLHLAAG